MKPHKALKWLLAGILLCVLLFVLVLVSSSMFVNPMKRYDSDSPFYRWLLKKSSFWALKILRVRVHITGMEKLPKDTKKILFVSNHRSNADPIVTWYALREWPISFISKAENFQIPVFGRIIHRCCFLPIDREDPREAIKTIHRAAKLLRKEEFGIGVYPEGTRSKQCQLLPFHNGVFKIAQKAQAPIAVLSISGTEAIHKNYPFHHTDVYLNVAQLLPAELVENSRTSDLGSQIREIIETDLQKEGTNYGNRICTVQQEGGNGSDSAEDQSPASAPA